MNYSTRKEKNTGFVITMIILTAIIAGLICGIWQQDHQKTWDTEYPMCNQHITWNTTAMRGGEHQ